MAITTTTRCPSVDATVSVAELLRCAADGDTDAWEEIVRRYQNIVTATIRSFRLQEADSLDAAQTTWLRLAEHIHQVRNPERLAGWLATTARRECLQTLRQRAKHRPTPADGVAELMVDPSSGPEAHVVDRDVAQLLWELVDELPLRKRILLRALFTDNPLPYTEVARAAGLPQGGIGPTRARALQQLRTKLDKNGLGPGFWL